MSGQIHWHEGLFLQAHHLQRSQKATFDAIAAERRFTFPFPYGVIESRLSYDALENMDLRFDRLHAIMPSGIEVDFPSGAELPSLNIEKAFATSGGALNVSLGVPLYFDTRPNTLTEGPTADARAKVLYRLHEVEHADENTGDNRKSMLMRRINARLLLDNEDRSDLEVIPLLRIVRGAGQSAGLPRQDSEYVGPCLLLHGSPALRELARDLSSQVEASRRELVVQLTRGGFNLENLRGVQYEQMLRLRTLNRFSARLPALVESANVTPFTMYVEFRELLGELTALHPDRDIFDVPAYNHDNPYLVFDELSVKIRSLLRGSVVPTYMKVPFAPVGGLFTATFEEKHFTQPNEYWLGIKTREDPRVLALLVENPDEFKLMPRSMASRAIRGVLLKEDRYVPLELPSESGLHYFRLLRSNSARSWEQIQAEKTAVIRWPDEAASDFKLDLYMTVPAAAT